MKTLLALIFTFLLSATAGAVTFYVDDDGNDANSCTTAQTEGTPKLTIASGVACLSAGDTLEIDAGTYTEVNPLENNVPNGTSPTNVVTIQGKTGATVTIQPSSGSFVARFGRTGQIDQYIVLDNLTFDGINTTSSNIKFGGDTVNPASHHIRIKNSIITNGAESGILTDPYTNFLEFINNDIHTNGLSTLRPGNKWHGMYINGQDNLIERNRIHDNSGWGIHIWNGFGKDADRHVVRFNEIYDNSTAGLDSAGIIVSSGDGTLVHHNLVYGNLNGIQVGANGTSNVLIHNNTIANNDLKGLYIAQTGSATGTIYRNNIVYNHPTSNITDSGSNSVFSNNLTTDPTFNSGSNVYTLASGSAAINAGSTVPGFSFNGSAPDQGAFETFAFSSCEVGNVDDTSLIITFENNLYSPLLPSSSVTTITARESESAVTVSSCARSGDNSLDCTLSASITGGNTVDISWASGNLTDSALIGNQSDLVQPFLAVTNQSCTNNVGGGSGEILTQKFFRFRLSHGGESSSGAPFVDAAEDVNFTVSPGGIRRVRIKVQNTIADAESVGFALQFDKDAAASYALLTNTCGDVCFCGTGDTGLGVTDGTATTEQLTSGAGFVAGEVKLVSGAVPNIDMDHVTNIETEMEYCVQVGSSVATGTTFDFRIFKDSGTALDAYTATPRLTVQALRGMR